MGKMILALILYYVNLAFPFVFVKFFAISLSPFEADPAPLIGTMALFIICLQFLRKLLSGNINVELKSLGKDPKDFHVAIEFFGAIIVLMGIGATLYYDS